jgi:Ca2+-binding EF-hand superfamily protein
VKNLFERVDQDMDDRISIEELNLYVKTNYLPFDEDVIVEMFKEASKGRGIIHEK